VQKSSTGKTPDNAPRRHIAVTVYFIENAATLSKAAKQRLDRLVKQLTSPGTQLDLSLQVTGFTEGQAAPAQNRALALARARAVRAYLMESGIDAGRIRIRGRDDCCYDSATNTAEPRHSANASDRRATIRLASQRRPIVIHFHANRTLDGQLRLARYSTLNIGAAPNQMRPLTAIVQVQFPASVKTISHAVRVLLSDSGYRLAQPAATAPAAATLLALPLPDSQRALGPLTLQAALTILAGPTYRLVLDPVHRLVSFALSNAYQNAPPAGCAVVTSFPPRSRPPPPCRPVRGAPACLFSSHSVLIRNLTVAYAQRVYRLPDGRYCQPVVPPTVKTPSQKAAA
jgi:conjugative transfer region protein (TIGR03748 family)